MNIVNAIIRVLAYSNIWISFGAVCFGLLSAEVLEYSLPLSYVLFIFCATLFTYNFQRLVKVYVFSSEKISGPRVNWIKNNTWLVYLMTLLSGVAACVFGWWYVLEMWWLFLVVGFFSLFYVWKLPILKLSIRSIPGIKIFVLGFTWVLAIQILPFTLFSLNGDIKNGLVFFMGSVLFMLAISIPFDIRDINLDEDKLRTIPQSMGVKKARYLAVIFLFSSTVLYSWVLGYFHMGFLLNTILVMFVVFKSGKYEHELYYSGLSDGLFITLFLSYYLF